MSIERKLKLNHHIMLAVMLVIAFSFLIRSTFIQLNSKIEYYPTEDPLNYVNYEDYKTFEKVAETLDIKYEFSEVPDKKRLAESMILKKKQEDKTDKMMIQSVIAILIVFILTIIADKIVLYRDRQPD